MIKQKLGIARATHHMMRRDRIATETILAGQSIGDIALGDVERRSEPSGSSVQRIAQFIYVDDPYICVAILHWSVFLKMCEGDSCDLPPLNPSTVRLRPLISILSKSYSVNAYEYPISASGTPFRCERRALVNSANAGTPSAKATVFEPSRWKCPIALMDI